MNELDVLREALAAHCRQTPRGGCPGCDNGEDCIRTLMPRIDGLLAAAHARLAATRRMPPTGEAPVGLGPLRRLVDELSIVALDCGRVPPIVSIDQGLAVATTALGPVPVEPRD